MTSPKEQFIQEIQEILLPRNKEERDEMLCRVRIDENGEWPGIQFPRQYHEYQARLAAIIDLFDRHEQLIIQQFVDFEKNKWDDADHCTCLLSAVSEVFGLDENPTNHINHNI